MAIRGRKHIHRYLPSKCCSWKCKCGSTWAACLGGHADAPCVCGFCPSALLIKAKEDALRGLLRVPGG